MLTQDKFRYLWLSQNLAYTLPLELGAELLSITVQHSAMQLWKDLAGWQQNNLTTNSSSIQTDTSCPCHLPALQPTTNNQSNIEQYSDFVQLENSSKHRKIRHKYDNYYSFFNFIFIYLLIFLFLFSLTFVGKLQQTSATAA